MNKYRIDWILAQGAWWECSKRNCRDGVIEAIIDTYLAKQEDPYAHLKAAAADPTKQVRYYSGLWFDGGSCKWNWSEPPEAYEIRDKPKTMKKVKMLAWLTLSGSFFLKAEGSPVPEDWLRVPAEDKIIEVEE